MNDLILPEEVVSGAIEHMNSDHQKNLLDYAHVLAGTEWARSATMTAVNAYGFELLIADDNGRQENHHIPFAEPVTSRDELRMALINLAQQADKLDGIRRVASARVETAKASRYLKALCNHFDRKVTAHYDDVNGRVNFPFGDCELNAQADALLITVVAESETTLARVKAVVADHLVRFGNKEELVVNWVDED